jgi:hypothetical protein
VKRILYLPLAALLVLAPAAYAGHLCNAGVHCMVPPEECPDCSEACPHCRFCLPWQAECTAKYIDQLCHGDCCCERIKAAHKLGCRLHANWGCNPEIADALVGALECDTCWEVRQAAAWSLALQGARTQYVVLALYMAVKLDHNYRVRDTAAQALAVLVPCNLECCYGELFKSVDKEAKKLRPYYNPTNQQCIHLELSCGCIVVHVCKLEEEKKPAKEECLIPIKIAEDGLCPTCHAHAALPPYGAVPSAPVVLPAPGTPLGAPPPERLSTPPVPAMPPIR